MLSETRRSNAKAEVLQFVRQLTPDQTYLSVLTLGELRKGAAIYTAKHQSKDRSLEVWIDQIEHNYAERILEVNLAIAHLWGRFSASRTRPVVGTLIAATAIHHGLILVTRNVRDMRELPVALLDPWSA